MIPVLDLRSGRAVHARGGARSTYAPVSSQLIGGRVGDPIALARASLLSAPGARSKACVEGALNVGLGGGLARHSLCLYIAYAFPKLFRRASSREIGAIRMI